jgi:D-alanyl-D-alanine carboxypeptidase (penicillin-binding protein 5/6)
LLLLSLGTHANTGLITPPKVDAKGWMLADFHSGQVLTEHRADERIDPASLTKLMTAYVVFQELRAGKLKLGDSVKISKHAWDKPGSRMFVRAGSEASVEELIKGLLILSGNDAAVALAERVAGSETAFVTRMNAEAQTLRLINTRFANSTGLSAADHYSSVRDLTRLSGFLIRDFPEYYHWNAAKEYSYGGITQYNRNALLWRTGGVDGIKTGHTRSAGYCMIASAARDQMRLIATIIGAASEQSRTDTSQALLDFGFRHYETRLLYQASVPATEVRVWMGASDKLPVGVGRDLYLTLPRGAHTKLEANVAVKDAQAPVRLGQALGTLSLSLDKKPFAEYPLVALREIETGNILQRGIDNIKLWFK